MTQHLTDRSDTARAIADDLLRVKQELDAARDEAIRICEKLDAVTYKAHQYEYASWTLGFVCFALCIALAMA